MPKTDPRVDAYIAAAAPFARPVLEHLRAIVHAACPDTEETIKWRFPHFMHGGRILMGMAAFKEHCALGFWYGREAAAQGKGAEAMGQFGRIASLKDLPAKTVLRACIKDAMSHIDAGTSRVQKAATPRPALDTPDDFATALVTAPAARKTFESFAPTHRRDYVEWITEAKRPETRAQRIAQSLEWLAEGKRRNWKYEAC
ncbi:MAG: YdeI/OmpD-associated family protein [Proteobacteria bacterium]|nr:YdeI/OmpD-associated family protein [Pseudomonadota bacterium]